MLLPGLSLPSCASVSVHETVPLSSSTLLPSALARGSESRFYSHEVRMYLSAYVRAYVRTFLLFLFFSSQNSEYLHV